jgi:hypothetical protein
MAQVVFVVDPEALEHEAGLGPRAIEFRDVHAERQFAGHQFELSHGLNL